MGLKSGSNSKERDQDLAPILDHDPHITWFAAFTTYLAYAILIFMGRVRDIIGVWTGDPAAPKKAPKGMAPLIFASENFYTRRLYYRVHEAFNRPIKGAPGANINVVSSLPLMNRIFYMLDDFVTFIPAYYFSLR
jgi:hypothetical protein